MPAPSCSSRARGGPPAGTRRRTCPPESSGARGSAGRWIMVSEGPSAGRERRAVAAARPPPPLGATLRARAGPPAARRRPQHRHVIVLLPVARDDVVALHAQAACEVGADEAAGARHADAQLLGRPVQLRAIRAPQPGGLERGGLGGRHFRVDGGEVTGSGRARGRVTREKKRFQHQMMTNR